MKAGRSREFICYFSEQREIMIMAANYLQSLDWKNQPEILSMIITYYSTAKAFDLLANFYVACAQVEIDEFQNYEKAFRALTKASRCLRKKTSPKDSKQIQKASEIVQQRLTMVKKFVDIRRLFERGDAKTGVTHCQQLLISGEELEPSVRRGDIYALMIQHYVKNGNFSEAIQMCFELRQDLKKTNNMPITYYLNRDIIEELAKGLDIPVECIVPITPKSPDRNEDNVAEFIENVRTM